MLVYDYAITFPYEVRLFWRRKATGASLLFFANRYLTLFIYIFDMMTNVSMSDAVSFRDLSHHLIDTDSLHLKDVGVPFSIPEKSEPIFVRYSCNRVVWFIQMPSTLQYLPWARELYASRL